MLGLRQRRLELTSESSAIYAQIRDRNETLMDQRVEIAKITNPWTLAVRPQKAGREHRGGLESRRPRWADGAGGGNGFGGAVR